MTAEEYLPILDEKHSEEISVEEIETTAPAPTLLGRVMFKSYAAQTTMSLMVYYLVQSKPELLEWLQSRPWVHPCVLVWAYTFLLITCVLPQPLKPIGIAGFTSGVSISQGVLFAPMPYQVVLISTLVITPIALVLFCKGMQRFLPKKAEEESGEVEVLEVAEKV